MERHETVELDEKLSDGSWEALEEQSRENEQLRLMVRELSHLNSNYRHVTVAYYVDGLSVREISERFEISQSMVKYLLFQSRKRIKEGITMERNYGKLSYDPIDLSMVFWGVSNNYYGKFDDKLKQNILMCCYYDRQSEEQIALQLCVPTEYLEDDLKKLAEYDLMTVKNGLYRTNVPIITNDVFGEIEKANKSAVDDILKSIFRFADEAAEEVRSISDMPANTLKWMLVSLILHLAYIDMAFGEKPMEFPIDVFGEECFRFFAEKSASEPYSVGTSILTGRDGRILFWDVLINGERLHKRMTDARTDMLCTLTERQPQTDNEKLVCSELVELGLAVRTDSGIIPNFPCLTKEQSDRLNEMITGISTEISRSAISRTGAVAEILQSHTPAHLAEYVSKMPALLFFRKTEQVMQTLCESGWLLPMKGGMSGTTVMYLNK